MSADKLIEDWECRPEVVPIGKLMVDKEYQRRLTSLAREIGDDLIPPLLGALCVSARRERNGAVQEGAVFDGQNRLEGVKRHNDLLSKGALEGGYLRPMDSLLCLVYAGLSQAQEAQLFEWIQTKRRNAQSYDRFRAALIAGKDDPANSEAHAIQAVVESAGYEVGYAGMSDRTISAVRALETMYRRDLESMERALVIFREGWKDNYIPSGYQLNGLARFMFENPDADDERMVKRLFIQSPSDLEEKALNARKLRGGKRSLADMVDAFQAIYGMRPSQVERRLEQATA